MSRVRKQRHSAEVTADRLGDALERWPGHFDGGLRDAVSRIIDELDRIAETETTRGVRGE